jgi:hypothetical protein
MCVVVHRAAYGAEDSLKAKEQEQKRQDELIADITEQLKSLRDQYTYVSKHS